MPRTPSPAAGIAAALAFLAPPAPLIYREHPEISGSVNDKPCSRKIRMHLQSLHTQDSGSVHPPLREFRAGKDGPK